MKSLFKYLFFNICFLFCSISLFSQDKNINPFIYQTLIEDGDTLVLMNLEPVQVFSPRTFKNKKEERKYGRLKRYVVKVYPYAKIAGEMLKEFDDTLKTFKSELQKKKLHERS